MQFTQILRHEKGRYWSISTQLYGELICPWENGEYGSMIDLYDSDTLRFIDYYYEPACDGKDEVLLKNHLTEEDMKQCPIVAEGIVVYWMKECCDKAFQYDVAQLFNNYYDKCFKDYERWQRRAFDYWKQKDKAPLTFAKKHLSDETGRIAISKTLAQYLPEKDMEKINDLTENYLAFVKSKIPLKVKEISWEEEKQCFKAAVLHVMGLKIKKDGSYLFKDTTQWKAVYRFAVDFGIMYDIEDPREPEDKSTPQYAFFYEFAHKLQLDVNPPTRLPFKLSYIDCLNKEIYARYRKSYPWPKDGLKKPSKGLTLYRELNGVYKALKTYFFYLVQKASIATN